MKWLFGLLLLANVGLLMWGVWYRHPLVPSEVPTPLEDVASNKLRLLSEPGVRLTLSSRATTAGAPASPPCYRLGPFRNPDSARTAGERLGSWGLAYQRVPEFETQGVTYRLYLPPLPTREAAEARRRELTQLGFQDHAVIQEDDLPGYPISLGIFSVEQNAQARLEQLEAKGVHAVIQAVPRVRTIFWLAFAQSGVEDRVGDVPASRFAEEDWGSPEVALKPGPCAAVEGAPSKP